MSEKLVTIKELESEFGIDRSNVRKYVLAHGFEFTKIRTPESRGQLTLALSLEDAEAVRQIRAREGFKGKTFSPVSLNGEGVFYLIQVVPDLASNRVKLGFTTNIEARMASHRTAAPTAKIINIWPCKKQWEQAALDSITRLGCKEISSEVFECDDLSEMIGRAVDFFQVMPHVGEVKDEMA